MSYSLRTTHDGGHFYSHLLKKQFPFRQTRDNSDRRRAEQELATEERQHRDAMTKRLQRPATLREEIHGVQAPASKQAEHAKIRADVRTLVEHGFEPAPVNRDANPWHQALSAAEHEARKALLPADRSRALRRVETYQQKYDAWQQARDAEKAAEALATDPKRQAAVLDAETQWRELSGRPDVHQQDVERAKQRMELLANGGTVDDYWLMSATHNAEMGSRRQSQADALDAQARELRAQAKQVRSGEPLEPAPAVAE